MDYGSIQHSLKPDQLVDALAIALALFKCWYLISMVSL